MMCCATDRNCQSNTIRDGFKKRGQRKKEPKLLTTRHYPQFK